MKNYKTTLWGLGAILFALGLGLVAFFDDNPNTIFDFAGTISGILAGIGLLNAKDALKPADK